MAGLDWLACHFSVLTNRIIRIFVTIFFPLFSYFGTSCPFNVEWIRSALFFFWPVIFLLLHLDWFEHFPRFFFLHFWNIWAFPVHSTLGGFGVPYYFLTLFFCIYTLPDSDIFQFFSIFQLFGHFLSTQCWVDLDCHIFLACLFPFFENSGISYPLNVGRIGVPYYWLACHFSVLKNSPIWIFVMISFPFFSYFGTSCPLNVEWIRSALFFFGPLFFCNCT